MGELAKRVLERRRRKDPVSPKQEGFVNIVTRSEGSKNLPAVESLPFQIGQVVAYRVPDPTSRSIHPEWQAHSGTVLQVDAFREMVLIEPTTETGKPWRWVAQCYVHGNQDEK